MQADTYQEYLKTDAWKSLCVQAMKRAGARCQVCNSPDQINTHHRTYERVGAESLDDLTVLCERCHHLFHESTADSYTPKKIHADFTNPSVAVPTWFSELNDFLCDGLFPSELIVIAGGTQSGKSAFVHQILCHHVSKDTPIALFTGQHTSEQVCQRMISWVSKLDGYFLRSASKSKNMAEDFADAAACIAERPIFIDDHHRQTLIRITTASRRLKREHNLALAIVDPIELIESPIIGNRDSQLCHIAQRLKQLAMEIHIPVVATVTTERLNRQDPWVRLDDVKPSGIINIADTVITIREDTDRLPDSKGSPCVIGILKQRNGPEGSFLATFNKLKMTFEPRAIPK